MTDIADRPYVHNLLQGMINVREQKMEHAKSLDVPEGQEISYVEPTINVGDAIDRSDLSYEEGNEAKWAQAQHYLRDHSFISLEGGSDQDGLYSQMKFINEQSVDRAKDLLE